MSEQVQELIDKIKTEGVQAAEVKASEIEKQAKEISDDIITDAKKESEKIIAQAREEAEKLQESARLAIQQASRDVLLTLRKKIEETLNKIVKEEVRGALNADQLGEIITTTIKGYLKDSSGSEDIKVFLSKADAERLKSGIIKKLQDQLKKPIEFEANDDIEKGFTISFDSGKSSFDFTDASLAGQLSVYLNEEVASLLKDSISTK